MKPLAQMLLNDHYLNESFENIDDLAQEINDIISKELCKKLV